MTAFQEDTARILRGGDSTRQKELGRWTARERLSYLLDPTYHFELGLFQGWKELPAAGVLTTIGQIQGTVCMVIANDATVKAGALFPQSVKKILRAQRVACQWGLPIVYLVDSSGVYLPQQAEVFPDEDDFGRIFRNNSVLAELGIPQIAAIMGNCIAGGGYLPVLCDQIVMTKGSGLYLAGPKLVEAAIGQKVSTEDLGGGVMHASVSGTVDFLEEDDKSCLDRVQKLVDLLEKRPFVEGDGLQKVPESQDCRDLLFEVFETFEEYKKDYGKTLVTGFGRIGQMDVGVVANQKKKCTTATGEIQIGGVIYPDSAEKGARFIHECDRMKLPLIFFQDVVGFMVGTASERAGIIRKGAQLVKAISTASVPKFTIITGSSFGAGHYALCGKAYDPDLIVAWPQAKYAVMGPQQAAKTMQDQALIDRYTEEMDIRFGASKGWVDAIIDPDKTKEMLIKLLPLAKARSLTFHTGVLKR